MSETATSETEYVPRELFDMQIENIKERINSDKELNNERMEKLHAVMEKNFALLDEKIEHVTDTLTTAINGLDKRIDDMHQSQTLWFTVFGILVAVVPIAVAVVQSFIK